MAEALEITILGLSITSSWGNGHATTYRSLVRALGARGHTVHFLERDMPWYAAHRDLPNPPGGTTRLYRGIEELRDCFRREIRDSDLVVVGSYVPDGVSVGELVLGTAAGVAAFYDIDTPVTLGKLDRHDYEYLTPELVARYDLYLSFTGGPMLARIEREYGAALARPLYCSVDPECYYPEPAQPHADLGYLGTYSSDRQPALDRLLLEPARRWERGRFIVAGPQYPDAISWPANVRRIEHVSPAEHRVFYNTQRFSLNITRAAMVRAGYSPSVRLFEAAACATPVISDWWAGLDQFFVPGDEILIAASPDESLGYLRAWQEAERRAIGERARKRVLAEHTAAQRAEELENYLREARARKVRLSPAVTRARQG